MNGLFDPKGTHQAKTKQCERVFMMQLLLDLQTNSEIDLILSVIYAFVPDYQFKHTGNGILETTIDASHNFTEAQWAIIANNKYTVQFVLPKQPTPQPEPTPAPQLASVGE